MPRQELLSLAAMRVRNGTLRRATSSKLTAGPGSGGPCQLCGNTLLASDVEYEVAAEDGHPQPLRFHIACYSAWFEASRPDAADSGDY